MNKTPGTTFDERGEADVLVRVENVSKKFCRSLKKSLWYGVKDIGAELLGKNDHQNESSFLRADEFWALQDINFELKRGECLGLIGQNGAGKSTLLKILNGLLKPDTGRIAMRGRVGALIELGTGFNPILSGRENIYINGSVLGFSKQEIDRKLDAIIDFAEIGDFIDMPVKNYSSGMRVRLGFAVAAQMEPDVLLIDEVLAVGDIGFVLKCFNRMDSLLGNAAIILVSHNMPQVARMCTNLTLMEHGRTIYNSYDIASGLNLYYSKFKAEIGNFTSDGRAFLQEVEISSNGKTSQKDKIFQVEYQNELLIRLTIQLNEPVRDPDLRIYFYDKEQRVFAEASNLHTDFNAALHLQQVSGLLILLAKMPKINFSQGTYSITVALSGKINGQKQVLFRYQSAAYFQVNGTRHGWSPVQFEPTWQRF
ncbi:ABC transporter ATP-binding protein [Desulfobulbus alkaliphilus]|uniref:ABC transporter ATP-binding protein n=1 Tax=Desulfobulbus alkaliphilus TaxID=869814 RepID=UPI0019653D4E|nr:ABC transporter ATP-binding protein [Desulfobulbus alkaliphilus]MBM9538572.1 ABC transporter ATP-binding protein [Desulfobulbus alkaliphilus]